MLERYEDCRFMDGEIIWCAATTTTKEKTTRKMIMLKADGLDEAIIGTTMLWGAEGEVLVYSCEKCINIFMVRDGMAYDEAHEFFEFNTLGAYVGEQTPVFVWTDTTDLEL